MICNDFIKLIKNKKTPSSESESLRNSFIPILSFNPSLGISSSFTSPKVELKSEKQNPYPFHMKNQFKEKNGRMKLCAMDLNWIDLKFFTLKRFHHQSHFHFFSLFLLNVVVLKNLEESQQFIKERFDILWTFLKCCSPLLSFPSHQSNQSWFQQLKMRSMCSTMNWKSWCWEHVVMMIMIIMILRTCGNDDYYDEWEHVAMMIMIMICLLTSSILRISIDSPRIIFGEHYKRNNLSPPHLHSLSSFKHHFPHLKKKKI